MPFEAMNILYLQQCPWLRFWTAEKGEIQDFYVPELLMTVLIIPLTGS